MRAYIVLVPFLILALWTNPVSSLTDPTGSNAEDHGFFGSEVAISGDFAVVGAPAGNPCDAKVYFYKSAPSGWIEQANFTLPNPTNDAVHFGESVAIDGKHTRSSALRLMMALGKVRHSSTITMVRIGC
jgi:hypothetical protein